MPVCYKTVTSGAGMPFSIDWVVENGVPVVGKYRTDFANCEWLILTGADYKTIKPNDPFDPVEAAQYFGFTFAVTMFLWLTAVGLGSIIKFVKKF